MTYETISYDRDANGVVELVLNRPDKHNAMTALMFWELTRAFKQMREDDAVRCCLLTGAGDQAFSSGADFWGSQDLAATLTGADKDEFEQMGREFFDVFDAPPDGGMVRVVFRLAKDIYDFEKPVVCAVNGMALGVGWCFAQNADFIYAVDDARLSYLFIRNALGTCDLGTSFLVPRQLGMPRAKELMMLGGDFTGKRAEELGLINKALPAGQLMAEARATATRLAAGPQIALQSMKRVLNSQVRDEVMRAIESEVRAAMATMASDEFKQAIAARGRKEEPYPGFAG